MNTYWISLPCDLLSSLASFQCSLLHHLHLSSDLGLSKYVNQHSHLNLSRNVRLPVLYDLDFNSEGPKEHPFDLAVPKRGFALKQTLFRHLLVQCSLSPQRLQVSLLWSCGLEVD